MKNIKKLLASLTALSCVGSLISAFPAMAEDRIKTFIVTAVNDFEHPTSYVLTATDGWTYHASASNVAEFSDQEYFSVGDVIEFRNLGYLSTELAGTNSMDIGEMGSAQEDSAIVKIDSIIENPEIKEFIVNMSEYHLSLKDETAEYMFWIDWGTDRYYQHDMFEYDLLQDGDTVSCYTYEGRPYIIVNTTSDDVITDYLIVSINDDSYTLMAESGSTYYVDAEALNNYLLEGYTPEFKDVIRFRNLYVDSDVSTYSPATLPGILEEIPDKPNTPAVAQHSYVYTQSRTQSEQFEIIGSESSCITLRKDGKSYSLITDWLNDVGFENHWFGKYLLTTEEILNQQSVYCFTWNGRPVFPVADESRDRTEKAYVVGVDNSENPQQYAIIREQYSSSLLYTSKPTVFTSEELSPYLADTNLKPGDVLYLRNLSFQGGDSLYLWLPSDVAEDRPKEITVIGSLFDHPVQEFILWGKNSNYTRIKDNDGNQYNIYFLPDGFETAPAPDLTDLKQGASLTCIVDENNIPIMLYQPIITPDGDANGDGTLDILDVIMINRAILGKAELPSDRIPYIDFNGDGIPDASDSLTMLKLIVGLE